MVMTGPSKRFVFVLRPRSSKPWDRAVLLTGAQLLAAGAVLIGGAAAIRAVTVFAHRDTEIATVAGRAIALAASDTERYVLDRSARIGATPRVTAVPPLPTLPSAVVSPADPPHIDPDLLPPLARADFAPSQPEAPATVEIAVAAPAESTEMAADRTETLAAETTAAPAAPAATEAALKLAAVTLDDRPPPVAAMLLSAAPTGSSIALAPRIEAPWPISPPKPKTREAETKKRRPVAAHDEHKVVHRIVETRHVPEHRRDRALPIRVALGPWRAGVCAGGPARWVGNRIYWGRRC